MYKLKSSLMIFMITAAIIYAAACSSDSAGTATVSINTGLGSADKAVTRAPAPENVTSIIIEVIGSDMEPVAGFVILDGNSIDGSPDIPSDLQPGMDDILDNYNIRQVSYDSATGILTLMVPAGADREFVVIAQTASPDVYYMGTTTATLLPDVLNNVEITMELFNGGFVTAVVYAELLLNGQPFESLITLGVYTGTAEIAGPDMETMTQPFMAEVPIIAPVGTSRTIKVTLNIDPSDPGVVLAWEGTVTADVQADSNYVQIPMAIIQTKILFPDIGQGLGTNQRIVQIDDLDIPNQQEMTASQLTSPTTASYFEIYDIDLDAQGRIYFANYYSSAGTPGKIIRVNSISATSYEIIVTDAQADYVAALALDRANNLLYFTAGLSGPSQLYVKDLATPNTVAPTVITLQTAELGGGTRNLRGLAIDSSGYLYVLNINTSTVYKFNPAGTQGARTPYAYSTALSSPFDVHFSQNYVYVSNPYGADDRKIICLNSADLSFIGGYGIQSTSADNVAHNLYGPEHFVAILNREIYFTDEASQNEGESFAGGRIVKIDNILGEGWQTYGSFLFHWEC